MVRRQQHWLWLTVAVFAGCVTHAARAATTPVATTPVARVQAVSGKLCALRGSNQAVVRLAARDVLYAGDVVGTGPNSKATLLLSNGARLELKANMMMEIPLPVAVSKSKKNRPPARGRPRKNSSGRHRGGR
ncbi:MAG: hypothetical protein M3347_17605 [Armatimonadota bacterium]|nr:hypothetical protein [Armatimonadota bacterium]